MAAMEIPITEKMKEEVHKGFSLFQPGEDGKPRGQINIGPDGMNIQILKTADRSTFIHETGHFLSRSFESIWPHKRAHQNRS
jgi:hypothetical protein